MGTKIGALRGFHAAPPAAVKNSLTIFLSSVVGLGVVRAVECRHAATVPPFANIQRLAAPSGAVARRVTCQ